MEYVRIRKSSMYAGPASDSLVVISSIIQQLAGLIIGEEAVLESAPEKVQELANDALAKLKQLNAEVNALVGDDPDTAKPPDGEEPEEKKKK